MAAGVAHEKPKIRDDEFVAAAAGVQFVAERAESLDQRRFNERVHVLGRRGIEPGRIACGARADGFERFDCAVHIVASENADAFERARPGAIHGQFVRQKPAIEGKRALEFVEDFVRRAFKAPTPQFIAGAGV